MTKGRFFLSVRKEIVYKIQATIFIVYKKVLKGKNINVNVQDISMEIIAGQGRATKEDTNKRIDSKDCTKEIKVNVSWDGMSLFRFVIALYERKSTKK